MGKQIVSRLPRTMPRQYEMLYEFVQRHNSLQARATYQSTALMQNLWADFANQMSLLGIGPVKTPDQWKKTLSEWKASIRRRSVNHAASIKNPLTPTEIKLLQLMRKHTRVPNSETPPNTPKQNPTENSETPLALETFKVVDVELILNKNLDPIVPPQDPEDIVMNEIISHTSDNLINIKAENCNDENMEVVFANNLLTFDKTTQTDPLEPPSLTIAEAILKFTDAYSVRTQVERMKLEVETIKARAQLSQSKADREMLRYKL